MQRWTDYRNGIYAFCANYVRPFLAAIHMVEQNGRVALVDTGSNDALPHVLEALARLKLGPEAVDYIILTHIHLDHAGGAGAMMRVFPNARLVVHPRGARHMAAPARLVDGVMGVYGAEYVKRVYGEVLPVPTERIVEAEDGLSLDLAGRIIQCFDAPGHARHHIVVFDTPSRSFFTGDVFGISYREMDVGPRKFIFPSTTPTQFEPEAMAATVHRMLSHGPQAMYLTHYSRVEEVGTLAEHLLEAVRAHCRIALSHREQGAARLSRIRADLADYLLQASRRFGATLAESDILTLWESDLTLNAQGLVCWLDSGAKA